MNSLWTLQGAMITFAKSYTLQEMTVKFVSKVIIFGNIGKATAWHVVWKWKQRKYSVLSPYNSHRTAESAITAPSYEPQILREYIGLFMVKNQLNRCMQLVMSASFPLPRQTDITRRAQHTGAAVIWKGYSACQGRISPPAWSRWIHYGQSQHWQISVNKAVAWPVNEHAWVSLMCVPEVAKAEMTRISNKLPTILNHTNIITCVFFWLQAINLFTSNSTGMASYVKQKARIDVNHWSCSQLNAQSLHPDLYIQRFPKLCDVGFTSCQNDALFKTYTNHTIPR